MRLPPLIGFDVDGTIAEADHRVSPAVAAVLRRLTPAGIAGVLVTGRTERATLRLAADLGFTAPQISCNGAMVTRPGGERLWLKSMPPADAAYAVDTAVAAGTQPNVWTADAWYVEEVSEFSELLTDLLGEAPRVEPLAEVIAREAVVKVMIGATPARLDEVGLERVIPGMTRSMPVFLEAAPAGATKQEAVTWLLGFLGIDPVQCWGCGDGGNDVGWLGLMGRVIAPASARAEVKALATQVVDGTTGVAALVEEALALGDVPAGLNNVPEALCTDGHSAGAPPAVAENVPPRVPNRP